MEQKPHKKDELMLANNVLKLAEDLIKVSLSSVISKVHFIIGMLKINKARYNSAMGDPILLRNSITGLYLACILIYCYISGIGESI